jgi:uncharacterized protein YkwD
MSKRFSLSFIAMLLALAPGVYPQQRGDNQDERGQAAQKSSSRTQRPSAPGSPAGTDTDRDVYTEDDVLKEKPKDSRLSEVETLEMQCFNEVNRVRVGHNLKPLAFNEDLLRIARNYSRRMAEENFFAHSDPDGHTVRERVSAAHIRWRVLGENLASSNGYISPVATMMTGWMNSPGHRRNLLDNEWRQTAVGAWISDKGTVYFTEIFMTQ